MQCIPKVSEILTWVAFLWQNSFDVLVLVYNVSEHFWIKCYQFFFSTSCELQYKQQNVWDSAPLKMKTVNFFCFTCFSFSFVPVGICHSDPRVVEASVRSLRTLNSSPLTPSAPIFDVSIGFRYLSGRTCTVISWLSSPYPKVQTGWLCGVLSSSIQFPRDSL